MDLSECSVESWLGFFMGAGIPSRVAADYAVTFSDNRMRLDMLPDLSKDYLRDMNITIMGDVIAILKHAKSVSQQEYTARKIGGSGGSGGGGGGGSAAQLTSGRRQADASPAAAAPRAAVRPLRSDPPARLAEQPPLARAKRTSDALDDGSRRAGPPAVKRRIVAPGPDAPDVDEPEAAAPRGAASVRARSDGRPAARLRPGHQVTPRSPAGHPVPAPARRTAVRPRSDAQVTSTTSESTRFSITGLGSAAATQRQPLGRAAADAPAAAPAPRQRITFGGEREQESGRPAGREGDDLERRVVSRVDRTATSRGTAAGGGDAGYADAAAPRRRVMPPPDSPERSRAGADGVRSASARARLDGTDQGFRSAGPARSRVVLSGAEGAVRPAPARVILSGAEGAVRRAPHRVVLSGAEGAVQRAPARVALSGAEGAVRRAPSRVVLSGAEGAVRAAPSRVRLSGSGSGVRARPAAAGSGVRARLGEVRARVTTGGGKVIRLKGSSVYSRLSPADR